MFSSIIAAFLLSASPASATFSISISSNHLVDANNNIVQLRGVNVSGLEAVAILGWDPSNPWGAQTGDNTPNWNTIKTWDVNVVRLPLNEASWLGLTCKDTDGLVEAADPGGNYQATVEQSVAQATAAGLYVVLDLHLSAPRNATATPPYDVCPELQQSMADADHSLAFWTSIATTFKSNPAVIFELFNEPFMYGDWTTLMQGGPETSYIATSPNGNWQQVTYTWQVAGMQQMLTAVRATGSTNVVLISGDGYNDDLSQWLATKPTDSANQMAPSWHPYPPTQLIGHAAVSAGGSGYAVNDTITLVQPNTVYTPGVLKVTAIGGGGSVTGVSINDSGEYLQTNLPSGAVAQGSTSGGGTGATFTLSSWQNEGGTWSLPQNWPAVQTIAHNYPIVITETGEHNAAGTVGSPWAAQILPFADQNGWSYMGWTWDVWNLPDDVLIKDAAGTPTDGWGQYYHDHLIAVASASGGSLALSATSYAVAQTAGSVTLSVSRTVGTSGAVSVNFNTGNITATAGTDYSLSSGTLNWSNGDSASKSIVVAVSNATPFSGNRTFSVTLSSATGSAIIGNSASTVTISGSLGVPGTLSLAATSYSLAQNGGSVTLSVGRSGGSAGAVGVNFNTGNITAAAGTDYSLSSGTLSWANGDAAAKSIVVAVSNATPFSGNKTFSVTLANPTGSAVVGTSASTVTIVGSLGAPGTLGLPSASISVGESTGTMTVTVNRAGGSSGAVSVMYNTSDVSAIAGTDYTHTSGTLNWANGDAAPKTFSIPIANVIAFSGTKVFSITLSNPTGSATLGTSNATVSITGSLGGGSTNPGLLSALVFPNPAVHASPVVRVMMGAVTNVMITIFNSAGRIVASGTVDGSTGNLNGQTYFDFVWTGAKSSGMFYAVVHGRAADGTLVKARVRFAVIQ